MSTDAGRNWVSSTTPPVSSPTSFAILPATKDSGIIRIVAGTMWNGIYISSDNGMTWTPSTLKGQIGAVAASDSVIYAGVYADRIYRSTDGGTSWTACGNGLPPATDVREFAFVPNGGGGSSVVALSEPSEIFLSTNNGNNWNAIKNNLWAGLFWSLTTAQLNSDTSAIFVGTESGVFRSTNAGFTWDVVNQGLSACIVTALGVSKTSVFAGTGGNGIFRSSDQGFTWIPVNNGLDSAFIESIQTYGGLTVNSIASFGNTLLAGTLAGIFRSADKGATWNDVNNDWTRQQIWSFTKSDSAIFAGGSVFLVFRSTDDGITWNHGDTSFSSGSVMALTSENGKLFAAAMEGGAYRSIDNGINWSKIYSPSQFDYPYALAYVSPYLLLGAGTQGLLRSNDDGNTWTGGSNGLPADCDIYDFVVTGSNVFAGTNGGVFLSTDFGLHWSNVTSKELNSGIRSLAIVGSDLVAGTGGAGVIWKRPLSEMIAFSNVSERIPAFNFELEQNYPNPFNPTTTIKYSIIKESFVTIKVYDILGKEITTLVNEKKPLGKYSVNFNASNLPSGVYLYRMKAIPEGRQAGRFVSTKKFVLLK
ncbi:MAG: T9SS type A sorting domain-containing protein [Ignavibacteriaceae bacterium]